MNEATITITLTHDKEIEFMRLCVAEGLTICEKLNALGDDFLCGKVKLTRSVMLPNR